MWARWVARGAVTAAADGIHIKLTGRGGHTSRPHLTEDLTYALAKVITEVPAVLSRSGPARRGADRLGPGTPPVAGNVIPIR